MSFPNYLGRSCQPKYTKTKEFVQIESEYTERTALGFADIFSSMVWISVFLFFSKKACCPQTSGSLVRSFMQFWKEILRLFDLLLFLSKPEFFNR